VENIRNFSIIAHIDHGKSTLADRLLEVTGTIEKRKMREQVLDQMELERERGITIKMQPVRLKYHPGLAATPPNLGGEGSGYILNLIDTPGHIDFSYEVSRALQAVEGVLLLVDATQGVQAQTLSVLAMARELKLTIIPVINKIDLPVARVEETKQEIVELLACSPESIIAVSGKTGAGVPELLAAIVERIPPPQPAYPETKSARALVFDFEYSTHQGVIVYARVLDGRLAAGDELIFDATGEKFRALEVGIFAPERRVAPELSAGSIGYVVTGLKKPGQANVGDTITRAVGPLPAVPGYAEPKPVVWASIYPESQDDLPMLRLALGRLKLSDAALSFEEESSSSLGRGFRCGFLGLLHLEIITERLRREFSLTLIIATPTIGYRVRSRREGTEAHIYSPHLFPDDTRDYEVWEPWARVKLIMPPQYLNGVMKLLNDHEAGVVTTANWSHDRTVLEIELPLRELMRNFFDEVKSVSSGFASFSYELIEERPADVARLDVLIGEKVVPAFSRVVARRKVDHEAQAVVEKLKNILPRQLITVKIQAQAGGRIVASRTLSALRKDVTDYLYGGDITRKMKLREKQKKGKKKMQARGSVSIPHEVFLKMINSER
jgi:GTP-binding protein LepA